MTGIWSNITEKQVSKSSKAIGAEPSGRVKARTENKGLASFH
jgi:hypothetical protein